MVVVVHVQRWDIENLLEVRGLHTAPPKRVSELLGFPGRSPAPEGRAEQARHRPPLQPFAALGHRAPGRARIQCRRVAPPSLRPPLSKRSRPRSSCELTTLFVRQPVVLGGCSLRGIRTSPPWSCPSSGTLEVWCFFSDSTMATGSRSWRKNWHNRRSLHASWRLQGGHPLASSEGSARGHRVDHMKVTNTRATQKGDNLFGPCIVVVVWTVT